MTINYTANLSLAEPVTGTESGTWGDDVNKGLTDYLDISIAGTNTITTDADVTLTQTTGSSSGNNISGTTAQYYILNCTGARTANRSIIAPAISKTYYVINATTGGYTITIKKSGGTGVVIPPGAAALVAYNGTDFQGVNPIIGTLGYSDTNIVSVAQGSVNTYIQTIIQNTNSGSSASADYIVNNNLGTATTYYGDFGMNSSGWSGSGAFNTANTVYLTATSGDLAIGTTTANAIHFVVNGGTTDAMAISSSGTVTINGSAISLAGNLTTSGAYALTLTTTGATNVTLPTSGTLSTIALSGTNTWTGSQTFSGSTSVFGAVTANIAETTNVISAAPSSTQAVYTNNGAVQYFTSNAANNWTINLAFSSGTSMNTTLATGQSVTMAVLTTQGSTAYYNTAVQVDGTTSGVTTKWQGGAPTSGNASGIDVYTYTITKTASATYTVLASLTQFK